MSNLNALVFFGVSKSTSTSPLALLQLPLQTPIRDPVPPQWLSLPTPQTKPASWAGFCFPSPEGWSKGLSNLADLILTLPFTRWDLHVGNYRCAFMRAERTRSTQSLTSAAHCGEDQQPESDGVSMLIVLDTFFFAGKFPSLVNLFDLWIASKECCAVCNGKKETPLKREKRQVAWTN